MQQHGILEIMSEVRQIYDIMYCMILFIKMQIKCSGKTDQGQLWNGCKGRNGLHKSMNNLLGVVKG